MQNDIKNLDAVTAGAQLLDVLTAVRINAIQNLIKEVFFGANVSGAGGIKIERNANGFNISIDSLTVANAVIDALGKPNGVGYPEKPSFIELELCDGRKISVLAYLNSV